MPPTAPSRPRRARTMAGVLLLLVGTILIGYVAWQLLGTNWVAGRAQESLHDAIVEQWQAGEDVASTDDVIGEALLRIPRFGADWSRPVLRGFDDDTLATSVGRYPEGAAPGEVGNLVLAGHRITRGEPFRHFLELRAGDEVIVETRTAVHTYELVEDGDRVRVDFSTTWPLQAVPEEGAQDEDATEAVLTLLTCSELFHTSERSVVRGRLVDSRPRW